MHIKIYKKIDVPVFFAFVIILAASALRVTLAILHWPPPNSDEAFMQLMSIHIDKLGERPMFYYGQNYMGTLEAYVGALSFHIFGSSLLAMRFAMISFFLIFLISLYVLTSCLYSRSFALLTIVILSLGTSSMFQLQMRSIGGYTEILPLAVMVLLISYKLAVLEKEASLSRKGALYALWGLLVGLALWSDVLIVPYLLIASVFLVLFCWRDLFRWSIWIVLLGFAIGAFPLIFYNLTAAPGTDSLTTFFQQSNVRAPNPDPFWPHIFNTLLSNLPGITGFQPAHMVIRWDSTASHAIFYKVAQLVWGVGYCLLLCLSLVLALISLAQARRLHLPREAHARSVLQFLLACGGLLSIALFVKSSSAVVPSFGGSRYLTILWISTPAVLWPLWHRIPRLQPLSKKESVGTGSAQGTTVGAVGTGLAPVRKPVGGEHLGLFSAPSLRMTIPLSFASWYKIQSIFTIFRISIILMIFLVLTTSMSYLFSEIPTAQKEDQDTTLLIQKLEEMHITRFFSEYWTCARLIFASQEKLMCGDTWGNLTHGYDRYMPYLNAVVQAPNPAFVYPIGYSSLNELEHALNTTHTGYYSTTYKGYIIIQPAYRIPGVPLYQPEDKLPITYVIARWLTHFFHAC